MAEKLLLKTTLYDLLKSTNDELFRLYQETEKNKFVNRAVVDAKISCLLQHKSDLEKLIQICVDRNKF